MPWWVIASDLPIKEQTNVAAWHFIGELDVEEHYNYSLPNFPETTFWQKKVLLWAYATQWNRTRFPNSTTHPYWMN